MEPSGQSCFVLASFAKPVIWEAVILLQWNRSFTFSFIPWYVYHNMVTIFTVDGPSCFKVGLFILNKAAIGIFKKGIKFSTVEGLA